MGFLSGTSSILDLIISLSVVIGGGVASYFLIRYQVTKNLTETIDIYRKEVDAYKLTVDRLEKDLGGLKNQYDELKKKKNYLKQILLEALTTKADIRDLLEKSLKDESKK